MSLVKEEVLHSKHTELKDRLRGINQGFDRLRKVSHQGYGAESGTLRAVSAGEEVRPSAPVTPLTQNRPGLWGVGWEQGALGRAPSCPSPHSLQVHLGPSLWWPHSAALRGHATPLTSVSLPSALHQSGLLVTPGQAVA